MQYRLFCFSFPIFCIISSVLRGQDIPDTSETGFQLKGYLQAQYQYFFIPDTIGATTPYFSHFTGGPFVGFSSNQRFMIRRGRFGVQHTSTLSKGVITFDMNERGFRIKDIYASLSDPKFRTIHLQMGLFPRPFGFEVGYSSSLRESPERARIIQTLFPEERDMGVMLTFKLPEEKTLSFFSLSLAIVNGNGSAIETDKWKDLIGRLRIDKPVETDNFSFSTGFSVYHGYMNHIFEPVDTIASNTFTKYYIYKFTENLIDTTGRTTKGFVIDTAATFSSGRTGGKVLRQYFGIDLQVRFITPFGKSKLFAEYIWGTQPTPVYFKDVEQAYIVYNGMNSFSYTGPMLGVAWPMYDQPQPYNPTAVGYRIKHHHTFIRSMAGFYVTYAQEILNTNFEYVIKYDWYDPNTKVKGKEIFYDEELYLNDPTYVKTYLSPADIAYTTIGFGLRYHFNKNLNLTIYYDNIRNEKARIGPYEGDLRLGRMPSPGFTRDLDDDAVTIRMQYKF